MARRAEYIPAQPFVEFLEARLKVHQAMNPVRLDKGRYKERTPVETLAEELGWGSEEAGLKRLFRYRHSLRSKHVGYRLEGTFRTFDKPTDRFPLESVEEALDSAGFTVLEVYLPWIARMAGNPSVRGDFGPGFREAGPLGTTSAVLEYLKLLEPIVRLQELEDLPLQPCFACGDWTLQVDGECVGCFVRQLELAA